MATPCTVMRAKCHTCDKNCWHTDPVTLARLRDVPAVLRALPFDPYWTCGEVSLHETHTYNFETDVIKRQGVATILEKVKKLGANTVQRIIECYHRDAQARARPPLPRPHFATHAHFTERISPCMFAETINTSTYVCMYICMYIHV